MVAAREEFRTRRRAYRTNEEPLKQRAIVTNRIDVGRREVRVAVNAQIAPTLVVREADYDIRLCGECGSYPRSKKGDRENDQSRLRVEATWHGTPDLKWR